MGDEHQEGGTEEGTERMKKAQRRAEEEREARGRGLELFTAARRLCVKQAATSGPYEASFLLIVSVWLFQEKVSAAELGEHKEGPAEGGQSAGGRLEPCFSPGAWTSSVCCILSA